MIGKTDGVGEDMEEKRGQKNRVASVVGFVVNLILATAKIFVGTLCGILSVVSDGLNNLSDCGMSAVSFLTLWISQKPPDKKHPFGHERAEYVASLIMSIMILFVALEIIRSAIGKIISPTNLTLSVLVLSIQIISILAKVWLFLYYLRVFKITKSEILRTSALDSLSDAISTLGIVFALGFGEVFGVNLDGYMGIVVAVVIAVCGIKNLLFVSSKIIGQGVGMDVKKKIENCILENSDIIGIHDLVFFSYGSKIFANVHIELDARLTSQGSHKIIDKIEREVGEKFGVVLTAHHDPVAICDKETNILREVVTRIVKMSNPNYSLHDFRLLRREVKTIVFFDLAIPYGESVDEKETEAFLIRKIKSLSANYEPIIKIDRV